jgi:hypothetical protein
MRCLALIFVCLLASTCPGQTVKFAWDPPTNSTQPLTYWLYASTNALSDATILSATTNLPANTNLTATISDLLATHWWFAAASRDTNGIQSVLSNVLQVEVPKPPLNMRTVVLQYSGTLSNFYDVGFFKLRLP